MDYQKLIELNIQHEFYEQGFTGFDIKPSKECEKLLHNFGLHYKKKDSGIIILWDKESEALSKISEDDKPDFKLTFYLDINDSYFLNYTNLNIGSLEGLFHFSNLQSESLSTRQFLTEEEYVSINDFISIQSQLFNWDLEDASREHTVELYSIRGTKPIESYSSQVSQQSLPISLSGFPDGLYTLKENGAIISRFYKDPALSWKPCFGVIEFFLFEESAGIASIINKQEESSISYQISFQARSTYWRYYIIPKHINVEDDVVISNGRNGNSTNFINKGKKRLADGSEATVLDSELAIGLREVSPVKYNLKSKSGKTLFKALPTPSVQFINTNKEDEKQSFYSEMYVYL